MKKLSGFISELKRNEDKITYAEENNLLLEYRGAKVVFTPKLLTEAITKGEWHAVCWATISRTDYGIMLREERDKAIERLDKFTEMLETSD